ncbi:hypothetical protein PORY_002387 [Pneumocystis oryctolagi]|uniref:Uncharacterized protein n=1 Tax=Pneumocystis oryctolagi TaxID=42067 RepID=A0ACB7C9G9_9ASCO|nr:hypothetical protein PORY_002387 [Pneumocystis oryctolagi]
MYEGFQKFAKKCRKYALISMEYDSPLLSFVDDSYESKLNDIINDLNQKVLLQTDFLQKIDSSGGSTYNSLSDTRMSDPEEHTKSLRENLARIKHCTEVYEECSCTMDLTIDDALVASLLARQKIQKNTIEAQLTMEILKKRLKMILSTIEREQKMLDDSKIISSLLDKRLKILEKQGQRSSEEILNECYMNVKETERSVNKFMRELVKFIDEELGDVLLSEQLGVAIGHVDTIGKKHNNPTVESGQTVLDKHISVEKKDKIALCNATKELLENLMNQSVLPGADPYIVVEDSVVGRILLRSGLVVLHNKDATKMRLVEFHREIDESSFV